MVITPGDLVFAIGDPSENEASALYGKKILRADPVEKNVSSAVWAPAPAAAAG